MMTGHEGIFAGGDMVPSERSVTIATGHGKHAARHIDAFLKGECIVACRAIRSLATRSLHLWYRTEAPVREQQRIPITARQTGFDEITQEPDRVRSAVRVAAMPVLRQLLRV